MQKRAAWGQRGGMPGRAKLLATFMFPPCLCPAPSCPLQRRPAVHVPGEGVKSACAPARQLIDAPVQGAGVLQLRHSHPGVAAAATNAQHLFILHRPPAEARPCCLPGIAHGLPLSRHSWILPDTLLDRLHHALQIISSAIVNAPPPHPVVKMLMRTNFACEPASACRA